MNPFQRLSKSVLVTIAFLVLVPVIAHWTFSSLGFNPTDDGFNLAYSRRILEGQVPHRDFIIIRPFLSPLLHVPFVLWGGDFTYWISRFFVWFQLACIVWIWVSLIEKGLKQTLGLVEKICIALIAFAASAHTFPIMAWHTIDGLFLLSIGLLLCDTDKPTHKLIGYFLISTAYLCKQSFIFGAPLTLLVLRDWRSIKYWLAILFPGLLYVFFLLFTNALPDAIAQLTSQKGFLSVGLIAYLNRELLLGVLAGYFAAYLIAANTSSIVLFSKDTKKWLGLLLLSLLPLLGITMTFVIGKGFLSWSFGLFGLVLGIVGYPLREITRQRPDKFRIGLLVLITAWNASLSIGYNFPALFSGPLLAWLLMYTYIEILRIVSKKVYIGALVILTVVFLQSFWWVRMNNIYREQAAPNLASALDGTLDGGKWIRTNQNTYEFMADLKQTTAIASRLGKTYAIIPDCPGYWVKSEMVNPLPIDWPQGTELNTQELVNRVTQKMEDIRDTNVIIVQKYEANALADGFVPLSDSYTVVAYVREHFTKVEETKFFEIYR